MALRPEPWQQVALTQAQLSLCSLLARMVQCGILRKHAVLASALQRLLGNCHYRLRTGAPMAGARLNRLRGLLSGREWGSINAY